MRHKDRDPKLSERIERLFHAVNEMEINGSRARNSFEKRIRDATKPDTKQITNVKASFLDHNALFGYFLSEQKVTITSCQKLITKSM